MNRMFHTCLPALILILAAASGSTATAGPQAVVLPAQVDGVEDLLREDYYEIEFFVFERPEVTEWGTEEVLTLDRPRALPLAMRAQRQDPDTLWRRPMNSMTRACLTFPSLSYELLPPTDALVDTIIDEAGIRFDARRPAPDPAGELLPRAETISGAEAVRLAVPVISPRLEDDPLLGLLSAVAAYERTLAETSQRWMDPDSFRLRQEASRVERTGLGRVIYHGRWLQVVPPREAPDPILVQAGNTLAFPAGPELVGTVGVTLGRFLHFQADLFFHAPGLGALPAAALLAADGTVILDAPALPGNRYMRLSESRRMRSEEVHYLDHPKLGLVVRIDPVTIPSELAAAFEALEEGAE